MKTCRLCQLPIVEGESTIHDPLAYWAHHVDIHVVCAENQPDPDDAAYVEALEETALASRAVPHGRQLRVSREHL